MQNYEKLKEIGKGSYGVVWLVSHKKDKKQYVLKQIDLRKTSHKDIQSAQQEAKLLSKLKHPNIVSYKDSFEANGYLYIAMLYCEGGDLYTKIKQQNNKHLEETQVVEWFVQIAMALQYMHEAHILHRDLKTQNIFLTKNKIIKVGDLGIARVLSGNNDMATTIIGTPYYMSPELFSSKPYNSKSDVWALGCCVYEMATLKHAFNAKDINSLVFKILRGKMPPMPNVYSKELISLIESMLNADPKNRPSVNKILRDPYIRLNIKSFLDRTKARNSVSVSVSASQDSQKSLLVKNNSELGKNSRQEHAQDHLQEQQQQKRIINNERKIENKNYNSNLYITNDEKVSSVPMMKNKLPKVENNSRPSSATSINKENGLINSDSDGEYRHNKKPQQLRTRGSSPQNMNKEKNLRISENSPQRQQQEPEQQKISSDLAKPRLSVRISPFVTDYENDQQIELVDKNVDNKISNNNNDLKVNFRRVSSTPASSDINEKKDQTPKILSRPSSSQSVSSDISDVSVIASARERRRQRIRLSQNEENLDSKPPLLIRPALKNNEYSEIDSKGRQKSSAVSKSYGANIDIRNDDENLKDFPFKDSLKIFKNKPIVSKSEDLSKVNHSKSTPNIRHHQSNPLPPSIPNKSDKNNKIPVKAEFLSDDSSSSSEVELEPEKAKIKQQQKDKKEVDNFINALNTTLNSLCIHKADSEIDEFDEVEDNIEEVDENVNSISEEKSIENNSNEETLKPVNPKAADDLNFKSFANMTLGTLNATKKMQDRIFILEKDCIDGIGRKAFDQAYEILENIREEEIEPKLKDLLGKKTFDNYVGKIWQLKFYKDSEKLTKR